MDKPESSTEADPGGPARPRTPAAPGSRKRPRFFHQPVITAFVRTLLGDRRTTTSTEDSRAPYDEAALACEARQGSGQGQRESPLRFLAPARLLIEKTERGARGEARYCRDGRDLSLGLFLSRLYDSFADLLRVAGSCPCRARRPPCSHRPGNPPSGLVEVLDYSV